MTYREARVYMWRSKNFWIFFPIFCQFWIFQSIMIMMRKTVQGVKIGQNIWWIFTYDLHNFQCVFSIPRSGLRSVEFSSGWDQFPSMQIVGVRQKVVFSLTIILNINDLFAWRCPYLHDLHKSAWDLAGPVNGLSSVLPPSQISLTFLSSLPSELALFIEASSDCRKK